MLRYQSIPDAYSLNFLFPVPKIMCKASHHWLFIASYGEAIAYRLRQNSCIKGRLPPLEFFSSWDIFQAMQEIFILELSFVCVFLYFTHNEAVNILLCIFSLFYLIQSLYFELKDYLVLAHSFEHLICGD